MFIRFDKMYERDRHMDGQTHRMTADRACIPSRGRNGTLTVMLYGVRMGAMIGAQFVETCESEISVRIEYRIESAAMIRI